MPGANYPSVYCNASNDCHVVGDARRFGHWDGSTWTRLSATGSLANTNLLSVNCDSAADCWAAGSGAGGGKFYYGTGSPVAWVGIDESGLSVFSVGTNSVNSLFCNTGGGDCWAVGGSNVFAHYLSGAWADDTGAQQGSAPSVQYNSVFCNSTSDCWAVGNLNGSNDTIVHWNGSSWSLNASNPAPAVNLNAVDCANTNDCWAAGASSGGQPVFIHWDGSAWSNFAVSGLPNVIMRSLSIVSPASKPMAGWTENFS